MASNAYNTPLGLSYVHNTSYNAPWELLTLSLPIIATPTARNFSSPAPRPRWGGRGGALPTATGSRRRVPPAPCVTISLTERVAAKYTRHGQPAPKRRGRLLCLRRVVVALVLVEGKAGVDSDDRARPPREDRRRVAPALCVAISSFNRGASVAVSARHARLRPNAPRPPCCASCTLLVAWRIWSSKDHVSGGGRGPPAANHDHRPAECGAVAWRAM